MYFPYLFLSARIREKCQERPVLHRRRLSPLPPAVVHAALRLLEPNHIDSLAGLLLTDLGSETCSCSGSLSTNNGVHMYTHTTNDEELGGGAQSALM